MISRENAVVCAVLACLALTTVLAGQWMTRPTSMDLLGTMIAAVVIYIIVAGAPQIFVFASAMSCIRGGKALSSRWWSLAYLVFAMQFGAGAIFLAGAILGEDSVMSLAATVLVIAALIGIGAGLTASRVASGQSNAVGQA